MSTFAEHGGQLWQLHAVWEYVLLCTRNETWTTTGYANFVVAELLVSTSLELCLLDMWSYSAKKLGPGPIWKHCSDERLIRASWELTVFCTSDNHNIREPYILKNIFLRLYYISFRECHDFGTCLICGSNPHLPLPLPPLLAHAI